MVISTDERSGHEGCDPAPGPRQLHRAIQGRKASGRKLSMVLAILLGVAALASCTPGQPSAHAPTPTVAPTPTATAAPRLLYQADWSHGLSGWNATPGFSSSGGVLHTDTGSDHELTSPFQPTTHNYAVEFQLQLLSVAQNAAAQFELSADASGGLDGYIALFDHVTPTYSMFANHPHLMIYIDPMMDQDLSTFHPYDIELGTRWRTYRVEVRGPEATLLIDGRIANWARSTKTAQLSTGPLRFYCSGAEVQLRDFKVYAL